MTIEDDKAERPWPVVRLVRRSGAAPEEQEAGRVDPPEQVAVPPRAPARRPGWNVRGTTRPGERPPRPTAAAPGGSGPADPRPRQEQISQPRPAEDGPEHDEWLAAWQRQEISWLSGRVAELERLLRWRTWGLGGGLALSGLLNILAVWFFVLSGGDEGRIASFERVPPAQATAGSSADPGRTAASAAPERPGALAEQEGIPLPPAPGSVEPSTSDGGRLNAPLPEVGAPDATAAAAARPGSAGEDPLQAMLAAVKDLEQGRATDDPSLPSAAPAPSDSGQDTAANEPAPESALPGEGDAAEGGRYLATAVVYLRAEPADDGKVLTVLAPGEEVQRIGADGEWLEVEFTDFAANQFTGYVPSQYLRPAAASPQTQ